MGHRPFHLKYTKVKPLTNDKLNLINVLGYFTSYHNSSVKDCDRRDFHLSSRTFIEVWKI